ncbi:MAG: tetratricopeptide repeat protein [Bacteroidales bacterium]|jgi:tetratricopeptide (TPR) repeat protein|nr:tetratricopeptide repeat protein [Bacteroidales bacterium]
MNRLLLSLLVVSFGFIGYSQSSEKFMPVTASSKAALSLYNKAVEYYDAVNIEKAIETFNDALNEDPDLFMANYQLALHYLMNQQWDNFRWHSRAAINSKARLSEGEKLLKEALVTFSEGSLDVVDIGRKLVELYPGDPYAYNNLISFQSLSGDTEGMVETIKKAISIAGNQAPFYNQLGYAYLILKQEEKAKEAFDRYIELDPDNPNVYDSKGDYFMHARQYDKAYESYIKAHSMDPSFSEEKARMARRLYEQENGRELQIITM